MKKEFVHLFFTFFVLFLIISLRTYSLNDSINVRSFGAKGDGINNDGKSFQKAINSLKDFQTLYIPRGNYLITQTLSVKSNISIVGDGTSTRLLYKWGKFSKTKKLIYGFLLENVRNVTFKNFSLDGGASNYHQIIIDQTKKQSWDVDGAYHLFFIKPHYDYSVSNIIFENLSLSNSFFDAIHTYGRFADTLPKKMTDRLKIINCTFSSLGGHGVGFNKVTNSVIKDCKFLNIGLMKMLDSGYGSGLAVDASAGCNDILIENNIVNGAGGGFKSESHHKNGNVEYSSNIKFVGNKITNLYQGAEYKAFYGIKINGLNCIAINNTIESFEHGILIGIDAKNSTIKKNKIIRTLASDAAGIRCDRNGGNHEISQNYIINTGAQGILIANSEQIKIFNNIIGESNLDNIRIAGGTSIDIFNNILYDASENNISLVPVGNMTLDKITVVNNTFFNKKKIFKSSNKRILETSTILNLKIEGNLTSKDIYSLNRILESLNLEEER